MFSSLVRGRMPIGSGGGGGGGGGTGGVCVVNVEMELGGVRSCRRGIGRIKWLQGLFLDMMGSGFVSMEDEVLESESESSAFCFACVVVLVRARWVSGVVLLVAGGVSEWLGPPSVLSRVRSIQCCGAVHFFT
jgi:hypothetical protein